MVSNKFLGALAAKLGFHRYLQHFSPPLQQNITSYIEDIQTAEDESEGAMDYWLGTKDSPKVCSTILGMKTRGLQLLIAIIVPSRYDRSIHCGCLRRF